jgi:hypothetical protein
VMRMMLTIFPSRFSVCWTVFWSMRFTETFHGRFRPVQLSGVTHLSGASLSGTVNNLIHSKFADIQGRHVGFFPGTSTATKVYTKPTLRERRARIPGSNPTAHPAAVSPGLRRHRKES